MVERTVRIREVRGFDPLQVHQIREPPRRGGSLIWYISRGDRTGAGVNEAPGAPQSRDPACAAAQVDPLQVHQNESTRLGAFRFGLKGIESESYSPVGCTSTSANTGRYLYCLFALQKDNARIILRVHHLGKSGNRLPFL